MRQVQAGAGKLSWGLWSPRCRQILQHGSGKEDQGPEMRLLLDVSLASVCLDPDSSCSWVSHGEEAAKPCGALRVMKLMENVELA